MSDAPSFHAAFYRFARVADVRTTAHAVRAIASQVLGSIVIAPDGINGMVAASAPALDRFERALTQDPRLSGCFADLTFQRTRCRTPPFARLKVHERAELLPLGVQAPAAVGQPGVQLRAGDWNALLAAPDVVVIDNRNRFEYRLGHFDGAVDPGVSHFRDMPAYLQAHAGRWRDEGRRVAMYCTGGIRCERTAVWLNQAGLAVYQLAGGILGYLAEVNPAQSRWQGHCFVFDNRIALDASLQECGVTAEDAYAVWPAEQWRLERARRLAAARDPAP